MQFLICIEGGDEAETFDGAGTKIRLEMTEKR